MSLIDKVKTKKDVSSKNYSSKSDKTQTSKKAEKRSEPSAKRYAIVSPESVSIIGEEIGISELPEDLCFSLAEDVSYKLREVVNNCCILLRNNKRRKLLTHDVNQVFETYNSLPIYGHSFPNELDFQYVPNADTFVEEDVEVDIVTLALSDTTVTTPGDEYIKGTWILPDPLEKSDLQAGTSGSSSCSVTSSTTTSTTTTSTTTASTTSSSNNTTSTNTTLNKETKHSTVSSATEDGGTGTVKTEPGASVAQTKAVPKPPAKPEDAVIVNKPPAHFVNYYLQIARVIIVCSNENHLRVALKDLRTNPKIAPLCPYFLNLVALSVNKIQRNGHLLDALLRTVDALVDNPYVDPSFHLAINRGFTSLLVIAIGPHVAKGCDDMLLRRQAATVLAKVLDCWTVEQKQQEDLVRQLSNLMIQGRNISLKSHFGAVVTLSALGDHVLDIAFWPEIHHYFNLLDERLNSDTAEDINFIKGAILMAAEGMFKRCHYLYTTKEELKRLQEVSNKLYEYFGDTLIPRFYLKSAGSSIYPPVVTAPVEVELTFHKENNCVDQDFVLRGCNSVIMLQRHLQLPYNLNILRTAFAHRPKVDINSVFSVEPRIFNTSKPILFVFEGSFQRHGETLKKKKLNSTQRYYDSRLHKLPQMWYRQNVFKCTRSIKYCSPSHKKSGAGDLFMII